MLETMTGILVAAAMSFLWLLAGAAVTGLPHARNNRRLRHRRTFVLWVCYIALAIGVLWCVTVVSQFIRNGWLFAEGTIKAIVPLMLIAHFPVVRYTIPGLAGIRETDQEIPGQDVLIKAAHPLAALPVYAAALASGMAAFSGIFAQPILPSALEILERPVMMAIILIVPAIFLIRRYQAVTRGRDITRNFGIRLLRFALAGVLTVFVAIAMIAANAWLGIRSSKLPEASDMMNHHAIDEGGGTPTLMSGHHLQGGHSEAGSPSTIQVAALTGDISAPADVKFKLVALQRKIKLASGAEIDAWTYNGEIAPELRVRQGDMVEVQLVNKDIRKGVTIHWHGYNVPNAMDGVPGMTQNAVKPGQSFTYKFRAKQEGTYWFHSHQLASEQVEKGLFGSLIVEPRNEPEAFDEQMTVINHRWVTDQGYRSAFGSIDQTQTRKVEAGKKVKLRIINTHIHSQQYLLQGADFRIVSIDGVRIEEPDRLTGQTALKLAAGGRYDVAFTMPDHPVLFKIGEYRDSDKPAIIFYNDELPAKPSFHAAAGSFDPSQYGEPASNALTTAVKFDREFTMILGNRIGFYNGKFHFLWTVNGKVYPDTPTLVVKKGEIVKTTFVNKSLAEHPMHLHGHHMTVLSKNGRNVKTPWMTDTLNVLPGEMYEAAFVADNPGMWMDHCHNLDHAATGMILHLMYDNVLPSYEAGTRSGNLPD